MGLYTLYALFILLLIVSYSYILFAIYRLKDKVAVEQYIVNIKLRFFTDISHKLHASLTLIIGSIEQILRSGHLRTEEKAQLTLVEINTNRMLHLVNQILDFHKIQQRKMMQVRQIKIILFLQSIMESFNALAEKRQMDFTLEAPSIPLILWADADKLEKIVFSLLSNAFKYTPQRKQIKVIITETETDILIAIKDQGIGIAKNKQKSIFARFETPVDCDLFNPTSTGIRLSLIKELIEMHHGSVCLQSQLGKGSTFTVKLPKGKNHFDEHTEFVLTDRDAITNIKQELQKLPEEYAQQLSPNDRKFMAQVMETIEQNLDNGNLSVEDIAFKMNMSRSVYFKKLKTLTGLSPVKFLREFRMKRAAQLINTGEYNMAQIAYMVGVNDSHYFSKLFKQQFGITPTEYKKNQKHPKQAR